MISWPRPGASPLFLAVAILLAPFRPGALSATYTYTTVSRPTRPSSFQPATALRRSKPHQGNLTTLMNCGLDRRTIYTK